MPKALCSDLQHSIFARLSNSRYSKSELLGHLGNSDLETQQAILGRVLPVLKGYTKVILGDREFCSVDLADWLQQQEKTYFCLRLKMTLILLVTLAYCQATLSGEIIKNKETAKYVGRVKEKGRNLKRHSNFYLG